MTIEAHDIAFRYPHTEEPALIGVSVLIQPGEVVGIVGPNGSGKSTLGRILKGLLVPTAGSVRVDGLDPVVHGLEVRKRVGLVFQNPNSQIVNAVVEQEVAFGPENLGIPADEIQARIVESLQAVGLQGRETAECHSLSMADKQRVALASVMAMQPRYLVLDESTAWLEPSARRPLLDEVLAWCAGRNVGLVLVTHRMEEAQLCGRLYGMLDGRVEIEGSPRMVLEDEEIRTRLALELPETFRLVDELRLAGLPVPLDAGIEDLANRLSGQAAVPPQPVALPHRQRGES